LLLNYTQKQERIFEDDKLGKVFRTQKRNVLATHMLAIYALELLQLKEIVGDKYKILLLCFVSVCAWK